MARAGPPAGTLCTSMPSQARIRNFSLGGGGGGGGGGYYDTGYFHGEHVFRGVEGGASEGKFRKIGVSYEFLWVLGSQPTIITLCE